MKNIVIIGENKEKSNELASFLSSSRKASFNVLCSDSPETVLRERGAQDTLFVFIQSPEEKENTLEAASRLQKDVHPPPFLLLLEDIESSFEQIARYGFSHVLPLEVSCEETEHVIHALFDPSESVGIGRYLHHASDIPPFSYGSEEELNEIRDLLLTECRKVPGFSSRMMEIETVIYETMINGFFHSSHNGHGRMPDNEFLFIPTVIEEDDKKCRLSYGYDKDKMLISVMDRFGNLEKETILKKIARQVSGAGVLDPNGRGLFLCYKGCNRIIFNLCPGEFCEILLFFYFKPDTLRPIQINTIPSSRILS